MTHPITALAAARLFSVLLLSGTASHATLLVYDGFTYSGSNLNGVSPNSDTIGLRTDIPFGGTGAGTGTGHYTLTTGLTFGSLQTSGRALAFGTTPANSVLSSQLSIGAYSGTLFYSYLVNFTSLGGGSGNGFEVRVGSADDTAGVRLRSYADSRSVTDNIATVDYNGGGVGASAGSVMNTNTTYLVVTSFTHVGESLSTGNPGVASIYVFSNLQFEYMMAQTDPTLYFNSLSAASVGSGASQLHAFASENYSDSTISLPADYKLHLVNVKNAGIVDEIRMGDDLLSVVPVPEPGSVLLMGLGGMMTVWKRRRGK